MKLIPAFVDSWDGVTMRVRIDGYTDGADIGMKAEVCYPFGDRPDYTGFYILKGDPVWVMFNNGDPNSPIVMGYRNYNTGTNKTARRFRHTNIETNANGRLLQTSSDHNIRTKSFQLSGNKIVLTGELEINGNVKVNGNLHGTSITDDDGDGGA